MLRIAALRPGISRLSSALSPPVLSSPISLGRVLSSMALNEPPTALVPIADGSEEIEALTLSDVLVRGGVRVTIAAAGNKPQNVVTMSRGAKIQADVAIEACLDRTFDLIVVPGGMPGAANLRDCEALTTLLKQQKHADKLYGAICAAPAVVLHAHGLLPPGGSATCYPSFEPQMTGVQFQKTARVVVEGKCVTSQGPATAMEMGVKLVELLCGASKAQEVAKGLLMAGY